MEKEFSRTLAFLDVCFNNKDPSHLTTSTIIKRPLLDYSIIFLVSLPFLTNLALYVHYKIELIRSIIPFLLSMKMLRNFLLH